MLKPTFPRVAILIILMLVGASACDSQDDSGDMADSMPATPPIAVANGWTKIAMVANQAKTDVDSSAHFDTSRNACGREADGALAAQLWNQLANDVNLILLVPPLPDRTPNCMDIPDGNRMDGTVDVYNDKVKREVFFYRAGDSQVCSTIQNTQLAMDMLNALTQLVTLADKEDCPNGWGH